MIHPHCRVTFAETSPITDAQFPRDGGIKRHTHYTWSLRILTLDVYSTVPSYHVRIDCREWSQMDMFSN